jgi:hypothetical protein
MNITQLADILYYILCKSWNSNPKFLTYIFTLINEFLTTKILKLIIKSFNKTKIV